VGSSDNGLSMEDTEKLIKVPAGMIYILFKGLTVINSD
jgi:hypothetical protein